MDHMNTDLTEAAAVAALNKEMSESIADSENSKAVGLPDLASGAATETSADTFDIAAATKVAADVDADATEKLKLEFSGCGRAIRGAKRKEMKSREDYYRALDQAYSAATRALQNPEILVALAIKKKIPTTKASWKNRHLVVLKLMDPKLDDKTASICARALHYVAAVGVPPYTVTEFLAQHGVVALAREEAKRQKIRKGGGKDKPLAEDPITALRREVSAVPFPARFKIEGMPAKDGMTALMIFGRQEGTLFAWAVDADEKSISAAARRLLKQIRTAAAAGKKDPEAT